MKIIPPVNTYTGRNRRILCLLTLMLLLPIVGLWSCTPKGGNDTNAQSSPSPQAEAAKTQGESSMSLWQTVTETQSLRVVPGSQAEADAYYADLQTKLVGFQPTPFTNSSIGDMLVYYGFPALLAPDLQKLQPAVLMDFTKLRDAVSNKPDFAAAYATKPLQAGEILVSRFFAPKIINVGDKPSPEGVPKDGFGWRKVLRFKARDGSAARTNGLDSFYLLFNFLSDKPKFPDGTDAGQIQGILVPTYPTGGKHNDIYFLVYEGLGKPNPGKIGFFLQATFDLASSVPRDGKYYVPRSCGQCHGTEKPNQVGGKVNYLDTDHWIDRTGDDFKSVNPADVLVDGEALGYDTIRKQNAEIEKQNSAVITSGSPNFALLAVRKWLDLHKEGQTNRHVPPMERALVDVAGDPVWTAGDPSKPDEELLPLLNQYCFRCHSSVRFHVFQKKAVVQRKTNIIGRITQDNMPQDRKLDATTKELMLKLINKL